MPLASGPGRLFRSASGCRRAGAESAAAPALPGRPAGLVLGRLAGSCTWWPVCASAAARSPSGSLRKAIGALEALIVCLTLICRDGCHMVCDEGWGADTGLLEEYL